MTKFVIEVINVGAPRFTKTTGGGYNAIEVAYKENGKVTGKKLVDFDAKGNPGGKATYNFFANLKGGEFVEVEAVKGEKFWNWVGATLTTGATEASAGTPASDPKPADSDGGDKSGSGKAGPQRGRVTGSNYETSDERARRQIYIVVRQSSIGAAIELLKANTTPGVADNGVQYIPITVEQVIAAARKLEEYVFEPKAVTAQGDQDIPF